MTTNLVIELEARIDNNGKTYYIGKIKAPALIDLSAGCSFLIFTSEIGAEVLQIAPMNNKNNE